MASGKIDGVWYDDIDDAPDLGSIRCTREAGSDCMIRDYSGLSADIGKLPKYVRTGSTFFCVDTGDIYFFEETQKTWHKQ